MWSLDAWIMYFHDLIIFPLEYFPLFFTNSVHKMGKLLKKTCYDKKQKWRFSDEWKVKPLSLIFVLQFIRQKYDKISWKWIYSLFIASACFNWIGKLKSFYWCINGSTRCESSAKTVQVCFFKSGLWWHWRSH